MNLSRLAVASQFSQSNKARSGRSEKAGKRRDGAPRRWRDLAQAVQQRRLGARDGVGDGRGEARDRRLAEEVVPRTSSRESEGVEEARSRLAGAGYSSGSNSGPAGSSCSGSASSRSRAATDGACASAAAGLEVMGTFAGFRDLRSFLLMPINKAQATTAKERPAATGTIKDASASERRFGTGDANDGEAVGEVVIKLRQISTECQAAG